MKNILFLILPAFLFSGTIFAQRVTVKMTNELYRIQTETSTKLPADQAAAMVVKRIGASYKLATTDQASMDAVTAIISWRRRAVRSAAYSEVAIWTSDFLILKLLQTEPIDEARFGRRRRCRNASADLDDAVDKLLAAVEAYNNCLQSNAGGGGGISGGQAGIQQGIAQTLSSDRLGGTGIGGPDGLPCRVELEALNAATKEVSDARTAKFFACFKG